MNTSYHHQLAGDRKRGYRHPEYDREHGGGGAAAQVISGTSNITFGARGTEGRACQSGTDRDHGVGHLGTAVGSSPTATAARACESQTSAQGSMLVAAAQRRSGRDTARRCGSRAAAQRQGHSRGDVKV